MKNKKVFTYVFRIFIFIIISLTIGLTIYTVNVKKITGNKLIMPFNKTIAVVLSGSMEPTIGINDLIVVEKTNEYNVDDIVVYQSYNSLVVHRIYSIDGDVVITLGDNNGDDLDDPISMKDIQGEVIDIIPNLGLVIKIIKSPIGIIIILFSALLLLILSYKKEKKESSKETDLLKEEIEKLKKELQK